MVERLDHFIHLNQEKGLKQTMEKLNESKILIFGGTGYIGNYMVKASLKLGHPTYVFSRAESDHTEMLNELQSMGAIIVRGRLDDHNQLVSVLREVDVVISALPYPRVFDQLKIIEAIKVASKIKRFVPSDFGVEEDRVSSVLPPFRAVLEKKMKIRRAIAAAKIPYNFVSANCLGACFVNLLLRPHEQKEEITVYGSGEAKAVLNYEEDVGIFTIKVATDSRTCNRIVTYRPTVNVVSQLELISMWEKKIGKTFNAVHVPEEQLVDLSESLPPPHNIPVSILHDIFVKGATTNFDLCGLLQVSALYPELQLTTIDELLEIFLHKPPKPASTPFA